MEIKRKQTDDELYHYGILGMKWGVRRYQNKDGSLTQQGLKRYNSSMSDYEKAKSKKDKSVSNYRNANKEFSENPTGESFDKVLEAESNAKKAKRNLKNAKKKVSKSYENLEEAYKIDRGKKLVDNGEKKGSNYKKALAASGVATLVAAGTVAGGKVLSNIATYEIGSTSLASKIEIGTKAAAYAISAATALNSAIAMHKESNIRSYEKYNSSKK